MQIRSASRTLCFWSVEGDNDSMITVWNYKATPQDLNLTLHYSDGQYVLPIHLAPRQSYNLDMLSLVRSRVPDANGNVIPGNTFSGSGTLASAKGETAPISVALAASVFNVRNATCGSTCYTCDGAVQTAVVPNPIEVAVGGTGSAQFQVTWDDGAQFTNPSGTTWRSEEISIATVDSNGLVTGASPGQGRIDAILNSYPIFATICIADHAAPCPIETIGGGGPASTGITVYLTSSNCFQPDPNGSTPYIVGYTNFAQAGTCALTTTIDYFPPGGSCVKSTSPAGLAKNCWQTIVNGCQTTT